MSRPNTAASFWSKTEAVASGCIEWRGRTMRKGYGAFDWHGKTNVGAHRIAWELTYDDPGSQWVLHHCDNPPCVNPDHLFLGDHDINTADKVAKGRQVAGVEHGRAKLSTAEVEEIRRRYIPSSGAGRPDGNKDALAKEFGVHPKYVYAIWRNRYRTRS